MDGIKIYISRKNHGDFVCLKISVYLAPVHFLICVSKLKTLKFRIHDDRLHVLNFTLERKVSILKAMDHY